jgi:hypothetical protein
LAGWHGRDFDRGLNAAVTRLRQALSDSAETPRHVETSRGAGTDLSPQWIPPPNQRPSPWKRCIRQNHLARKMP